MFICSVKPPTRDGSPVMNWGLWHIDPTDYLYDEYDRDVFNKFMPDIYAKLTHQPKRFHLLIEP